MKGQVKETAATTPAIPVITPTVSETTPAAPSIIPAATGMTPPSSGGTERPHSAGQGVALIVGLSIPLVFCVALLAALLLKGRRKDPASRENQATDRGEDFSF